VGTTNEQAAEGEAARKRVAVEIVARHEPVLRQTARRYSLCAEDAEDAYQRALEILLTKAPTTDPRELIRWTQTVTKHEALALRQSRERLLGRVARRPRDESGVDWVALVPAEGDGPDERVERGEEIARSREALKALKPAELRALSLLAQGYSYAEIGKITGFSPAKINRSLAEGRERFRRLLSHSEDGGRCQELRPLLSAFCDGEASAAEAAVLREHLRACAHCRATMRAYRATPRAVGALAPALLLARPLLERAREILGGLHSRLPGRGGTAGSPVAPLAATGGAKGVGMAALAKAVAVCAAGGAAACLVAGITPAALGISGDHGKRPAFVRQVDRPPAIGAIDTATRGPGPAPKSPRRQPKPKETGAKAAAADSSMAQAETVEYTPPPPAPPSPAPAPTPEPVPAPAGGGEASSPSSGGAAGEFGP